MDPNVMRVWHGTKLSEKCHIALKRELCTHRDCSICGISRKGIYYLYLYFIYLIFNVYLFIFYLFN